MRDERAAPWCPSTIKVHDDRWGTFSDGCILPAGHEGPHRAPRTACDPPGWLAWEDPENGGAGDG